MGRMWYTLGMRWIDKHAEMRDRLAPRSERQVLPGCIAQAFEYGSAGVRVVVEGVRKKKKRKRERER